VSQCPAFFTSPSVTGHGRVTSYCVRYAGHSGWHVDGCGAPFTAEGNFGDAAWFGAHAGPRCYGHAPGSGCAACGLEPRTPHIDRHAAINRVAERIAAPGALTDRDVALLVDLAERLAK
jgi:hypothetical protein